MTTLILNLADIDLLKTAIKLLTL